MKKFDGIIGQRASPILFDSVVMRWIVCPQLCPQLKLKVQGDGFPSQSLVDLQVAVFSLNHGGVVAPVEEEVCQASNPFAGCKLVIECDDAIVVDRGLLNGSKADRRGLGAGMIGDRFPCC